MPRSTLPDRLAIPNLVPAPWDNNLKSALSSLRSPGPPPEHLHPFEPFSIDDDAKGRILDLLGLKRSAPEATICMAVLSHYIAGYILAKANTDGLRNSQRCSVGGTSKLLKRLYQKNRGKLYYDAVNRAADDCAAIPYSILDRLQSLAKAVMDKEAGAVGRLAEEAKALDKMLLLEVSRVDIATEWLRQFCGILKVMIFDFFASEEKREWSKLRHFALEVLTLVGDERSFENHPGRLDEYLKTDVS